MGTLPLGDFVVFRGFGDGLDFSGGGVGDGGRLVPATLVLDGTRGELVRAPVRMGKKVMGGGRRVSEVRAALALKSHSEAERRRRERINAHLSKLRTLLPTNTKMDKATLLGEVINQVRELKKNAVEVGKRWTIPSDVDEVKVEICGDEVEQRSLSIKASLCCEDRPELLADLNQALESLKLKTVSAEISTVGGRMKSVLVMTCEGHGNGDDDNNMERHVVTRSVQQALVAVLGRMRSGTEPSPPSTSNLGKKRRIPPFESSSSPS